MDNLFNSGISIEKMAAFLDGNLSASEMQEVSAIIDGNASLSKMVDLSDIVDDSMAIEDFDSLPEELSSMDFDLPNLENFEGAGDIFGDNSHLYHQETIQNIENMNEDYDNLSNHSIFGEEGANENSPFIQQFYNDTCAIRSQQIIMRDYGIDISEHDLREIAMDNGWYTPGGGTEVQDVGNLLNIAGVSCHQSMNNTVYDLVSELSQGHRVIVGIDSGELWEKTAFGRFAEKAEDFIGIKGADHALIVAGVDVNPNDPKDIKVILTDPGSGDLRIEYKMEDFMDAWKDSNCFMVSTEQPAPYQFDPVTNSEVPSGFHSDYAHNAFVIDHGYQLSLDDMTLPEGYVASYMEHDLLASNDVHFGDDTFGNNAPDISFDHHGDSDFDSLDDIDFDV